MSNYLLWKRSLIAGGGIIGSGFVLYTFTTPTEEQLIAQLSPELKLNYLKNRELRHKEQEELMKLVQKTALSNDPIWYTGDLKAPWIKDSHGKSMLVVKEEFEREQALERQKAELELNKKLLEELELSKALEKKKRGWFW